MPEQSPIAADITGNLVVEIDQTTAGTARPRLQFYIGANESARASPGYISSAECNRHDADEHGLEAGKQTMPTHSNMVLTVTGSN